MTFWTWDIGYQYRFRPSAGTSLSPGFTVGYLSTFEGLNRSVGACSNCTKVRLDAEPDGVYLSPFLRATFGYLGMTALILRSDWFVTGDLQQVSTLGVEYGLP